MTENSTLCGLCGGARKLKNSHIMPRFIYQIIRNNQPYEDERDKPPMVADRKTNTLQKSVRQDKKHLFCCECEGLFSAKETVMSKVIADIMAMDTSKKSLSLAYSTYLVSDDFANFPGDVKNSLYFNAPLVEDIKYFFLSMIYREVICEGIKVNDTFLKGVREYLLGKRESFNVNLFVRVNSSSNNFTLAASVVAWEADQETRFRGLVPEFFFCLIFDKDNPVPDKDNILIVPEDLANCAEVDSFLRSSISTKRIAENAKNYLKPNGFQE